MTIAECTEYLIRCEAQRYSVTIDAELECYGVSAPKLMYRRFPILKRTPKGAWICTAFFLGLPPAIKEVEPEYRRFVLLTATKQYASETEEEARNQFAHRKKRQIKILSRRLRDAKEELALVSPAGSLLAALELI